MRRFLLLFIFFVVVSTVGFVAIMPWEAAADSTGCMPRKFMPGTRVYVSSSRSELRSAPGNDPATSYQINSLIYGQHATIESEDPQAANLACWYKVTFDHYTNPGWIWAYTISEYKGGDLPPRPGSSETLQVPEYCVSFEDYQRKHQGSLGLDKTDYIDRCKSANGNFTKRFEYFLQHYRVPFPASQMRSYYEVDRDKGFLREDYVDYFAQKNGLVNCSTIYNKDPNYSLPSSYFSLISIDPTYKQSRLKYGERYEPKTGEQCPAQYLAIGVKDDKEGVIQFEEWKHAAYMPPRASVTYPSNWWHVQSDGVYFCFWPGTWNFAAHPEGPPNCTKQIVSNNDVEGKPAGFDPVTRVAGNGCTVPIPGNGSPDFIRYQAPYTWIKNQYSSAGRSACTYADGRPIAGQPGGDTPLRAAQGAAGQIAMRGLVETTASLRVRSAPTASKDNTLATVPQGSRGVVLEIVRTAENGSLWAYVYYNENVRGYSAAPYLKALKGATGETILSDGDPADDSIDPNAAGAGPGDSSGDIVQPALSCSITSTDPHVVTSAGGTFLINSDQRFTVDWTSGPETVKLLSSGWTGPVASDVKPFVGPGELGKQGTWGTNFRLIGANGTASVTLTPVDKNGNKGPSCSYAIGINTTGTGNAGSPGGRSLSETTETNPSAVQQRASIERLFGGGSAATQGNDLTAEQAANLQRQAAELQARIAALQQAQGGVQTTGGLSVGARVRVNVDGNLNIRSSANGSIIGSQSSGAVGTIQEGPLTVGGRVWWRVDYDSGADGWSAGDFLLLASGTPGNTPESVATSNDSPTICDGPNTYKPNSGLVSESGSVYCWNKVKVNFCGKPIGDAPPAGWTAPQPSTICSKTPQPGEYIQLPADGYAFVIHEVTGVPPTLDPGQKVHVQASFMNCTVQGVCGGLSTWKKDGQNPIRVGFLDWKGYRVVNNETLPGEGYTGWGMARVDLPKDVAPGESVVVDFEITAPTQEGTYSLAPTLVQENKGWLIYATPAGGGNRVSSYKTNRSLFVNVGPGKGSFSQANYPNCPAGYEDINANTIGWSGLTHNGWWRQFKSRDAQGVPSMVQPGQKLKFCAVNKEIKYNTDRNGNTFPKQLMMSIGGDSASCEGLGGLRNVTFIPPSQSRLPTYYFEGGSKGVSWGLNGRDLPAVGVYLFEADYLGDQACAYGFAWGYEKDEAYLRAKGPTDFIMPSTGPR